MSGKSSPRPAYSVSDMQKWGCPACGYRSGTTPMSMGGAATWTCGDCSAGCIILNDGLKETPASWLNPTGVLTRHPREGTEAHGSPDKRPPEGGEFLHARPIGKDWVPACFVCGKPLELAPNIAAFVQCKEAGERVVKLFEGRARLDYREYEPDRIQVKIGVCEDHGDQLEELYKRSKVLGRIDKEHLESIRRGDNAIMRYHVKRLRRGEDGEGFAPGADWEEFLTTLDVAKVRELSENWDHEKWGWKVDYSFDRVEPAASTDLASSRC
jgi:hypothetical protein